MWSLANRTIKPTRISCKTGIIPYRRLISYHNICQCCPVCCRQHGCIFDAVGRTNSTINQNPWLAGGEVNSESERSRAVKLNLRHGQACVARGGTDAHLVSDNRVERLEGGLIRTRPGSQAVADTDGGDVP